ncbi:IS1 family transposase [Escherichia coli]
MNKTKGCLIANFATVPNLARLGRKSLSFSKSVELHDKVIGHYLNIKHYQ